MQCALILTRWWQHWASSNHPYYRSGVSCRGVKRPWLGTATGAEQLLLLAVQTLSSHLQRCIPLCAPLEASKTDGEGVGGEQSAEKREKCQAWKAIYDIFLSRREPLHQHRLLQENLQANGINT